MNTLHSAPESDVEMEHQAAVWLARRNRSLTPAEQDEFFQWLADDPRNGEWMARHQATVAGLTLLAQWQPEHGSQPNPDLLAPSPARSTGHPLAEILHSRSRLLRLWIPLGAAAMFAAALFWSQRPGGVALSQGFVEPPLIIRKVLEDGSTIDLNRGAVVEVAYTAKRRDVRLLHGEANFAVAKNPDRPFVVKAAGVEVRAVGTAFNVNLRSKTVEVLVIEGKVRVASEERMGPPEPPADSTLGPVFLEAGQRTVVAFSNLTTPCVDAVPSEEMMRVLAWQPRQLEFDDAPLAQVVAEFNASNQVKIVVDNPQLASVPVGASLRSDNVGGFVRLLEASFHVQAEHRLDGVIVLRAAK